MLPSELVQFTSQPKFLAGGTKNGKQRGVHRGTTATTPRRELWGDRKGEKRADYGSHPRVPGNLVSSSVQIKLIDPADPFCKEEPSSRRAKQFKASIVIHIGCSRESHLGVFQDQYITVAALEPTIEAAEVRRPASDTEWGCARCGSGIHVDECTKNLPEMRSWRIDQPYPWDMTVLPPKLVQLLEDNWARIKNRAMHRQ